jgi:hypothetical protein
VFMSELLFYRLVMELPSHPARRLGGRYCPCVVQ